MARNSINNLSSGVRENAWIERLSNAVVAALGFASNQQQYSQPGTGHRGETAMTSADQAPTLINGKDGKPIHVKSGRFYGALPSQGDWFSPPRNPPGNQSWKW